MEKIVVYTYSKSGDLPLKISNKYNNVKAYLITPNLNIDSVNGWHVLNCKKAIDKVGVFEFERIIREEPFKLFSEYKYAVKIDINYNLISLPIKELKLLKNSDENFFQYKNYSLYKNKKVNKNSVILESTNVRILCADVGDEENNGFALFKHIYENYKGKVAVAYLTNNKGILEKYPNNAFKWSNKKRLVKWCDTICYSYENFSNVSKYKKKKIFLQHGITWANSDDYISHILYNSTYATCCVKRELNYFNSLNTECKCVLTGMPIYDYDIENAKNGKNIVIMFTYRSNKPMTWMQKFVNSKVLKGIHDKYGYNIYFVKHHHPNAKNVQVKLPKYIIEKPTSELGNLVRKSDILITDYSSISFKAAYLGKSVYYYQTDYDEYCKDPVKSKGWFDWKKECLGFRSETRLELFRKLIDELKGRYVNKPNDSFFEYNDDKNAERVCKMVLGL